MHARLATVLLVVFMAVGARAGEGPGAEVALVTVGKVTEAENVESRRYTGHVISSSKVTLVARVSGEIIRLGFKEGENVEKGQVLCELDPIRYEAEVKNAEARVAENQARLSYAEISYNRNRELFQQKATSKDTMDSSESEHNAIKAALLASEAQLITTKDDLKNTRIIAPISGKIGLLNYTEGNYITPNSGTIATIIQMDPLRVNFSMSNKEFLSMFGTEENLKKLAQVRLRLADNSVYAHDGAVEFIDNQVNHSTDTVQIYAAFANPEGVLIPGSTVTVIVSRRNGGKVPAVMPSAIMHDSRSAYVYVVDGENKVERRDVVLGGTTNALQLLRDGVKPGELVVIDGMQKTVPGAIIEPDFQG